MQFKVNNSLISYSKDGEVMRESIAFQVKSEGREKISIADNYVFGDQYPSNDREEVSGRFTFEKINDAYIKNYKLDEHNMGRVFFYEASNDEFASYSIPALIYFRVFLKEQEYEKIKQALLHKLPVSNLACGIDGLDYGWEPDGSHQEWKLKEGDEASKHHLPLKDAFINHFNITFGKPFDDEYWEGRDDVEDKPVIKKESAIRAWLDEYGWYATVMVLIIGYLLFK